jgi:hypothetical protein
MEKDKRNKASGCLYSFFEFEIINSFLKLYKSVDKLKPVYIIFEKQKLSTSKVYSFSFSLKTRRPCKRAAYFLIIASLFQR